MTILALGALACADESDRIDEVSLAQDTVSGVVYWRHAGTPTLSRLDLLTSVGASVSGTGEPPPEEFGRVESVIADSAGTMYVADGLALEIKLFGPDGRYLRSLGGRGQGPGEIGGLHGTAWLAGDTMIVMDFGNARLSLLAADGQVVGQWPWMKLTGSARFLFNGAPGEIYTHTFRPSQGTGGRPRSAWIRYAREGPRDTLDIPLGESRPGSSAMCRGDGIGFFENPFADRLISRPAPGGERVVAWSSQYHLAFLSPGGDTIRVVTRAVESTPLPDSLWSPIDSSYSRFRSDWSGADCEGDISRPERRPIVLDIGFSHEGRLLVEYNTRTGTAFDLFELDGTLGATFAAPSNRDRSVPPFVRGDQVYVVVKDELDVQTVQAYRLSEGLN